MNYLVTDIKHDQLKTIIREANENEPLSYKVSEAMTVSSKCLFQLFGGHPDFVLLERAGYTYQTNQYRLAKVRFLEFVLYCATKSSGELASSFTFTKPQFDAFQTPSPEMRQIILSRLWEF